MSSVGEDLAKFAERKSDPSKTCALCGATFWATTYRGRPRLYCSVRCKNKACRLEKKK